MILSPNKRTHLRTPSPNSLRKVNGTLIHGALRKVDRARALHGVPSANISEDTPRLSKTVLHAVECLLDLISSVDVGDKNAISTEVESLRKG